MTTMETTTETTTQLAAPFERAQLRHPGWLLRLEGFALFAAATAAYFALEGGIGWYFGVFFVPDAGLLGYLAGMRVGAFTYNLTHAASVPLALGALAFAMGWSFPALVALVWLAHIGFDRAIGYGLKYAGSFKLTHLQRASAES